jgi:hypothetical protein
MTLRTYLIFVIGLMAVDAVVLSTLYSAGMGDDFSGAFFIVKGLIDAIFLLMNWRRITPTRFETGLILFIVVHALAGLIVLPMISNSYLPSRAANDVVWPILFLAKIVVFRNLISGGGLPERTLKMVIRWAIFLAVAQVVIFIVLSRVSGAYAGITPPVNLPLAYGLAFSQPWMLLASIGAILLSGKRAFVVGALVAVSARALVQRKNRGPFLIAAAFAFAFLAVAIGGASAGILPEGIDEKLKQMAGILEPIQIAMKEGPSALFDDTVRHELYLATAGRSEEIFGITSNMSWYNVLIGLGAGFTYSYMHWEGWVDGYANSHFSPLAVTYKFGIVYAILLYAYISKGVISLIRSNDAMARFVAFGIILFLVQSLFAFNLFVEMLFPFLIALRQVAEKTIDPVMRGRGNGGSDVRA